MTDAPMWISSQESLKLAVGECNFTCCEMNHLARDGKTAMTCSRKNVRFVLNRMIGANANNLFDSNRVVYGRWMCVLKHWWLRSLDKEEKVANVVKTIDDMESLLNWNKEIDADFEDREGVSLLMYVMFEREAREFFIISLTSTQTSSSSFEPAHSQCKHSNVTKTELALRARTQVLSRYGQFECGSTSCREDQQRLFKRCRGEKTSHGVSNLQGRIFESLCSRVLYCIDLCNDCEFSWYDSTFTGKWSECERDGYQWKQSFSMCVCV